MARTRAKDYEDKRRAILDTAAAVFARAGMEKASMAEIAREGRISKALLYHYYASKDALIFDIVRSHLSELENALAAADRPELPGAKRLRALVHAVIAQYEDADARHKVQLNGMAALPEDQKEALRAIERRIVRRFSAVLAEINPELSGERALLMPVTMSLFGMLNWIYMWFRPDGPISRSDYADMVTTLVLEGVGAVR